MARHLNPAVNSAIQFIHYAAKKWSLPGFHQSVGLRTVLPLGEAQALTNSFHFSSELFFNDPTCHEMEIFGFVLFYKRVFALLCCLGGIKKRPSSRDCSVPAPGRVQHPARCCLACSAARTCYSCICSRAEFLSPLEYRTVFASPSLSYLQQEDGKRIYWCTVNLKKTSLVGLRVLLIGRDSHQWCQLCWNDEWPHCPCCRSRTSWAPANTPQPYSVWQTCHVQQPGRQMGKLRRPAAHDTDHDTGKRKQCYLPHNGSLAVKAAIPADKLGPCIGRYQNVVQFIYKVLFQGLSLLI